MSNLFGAAKVFALAFILLFVIGQQVSAQSTSIYRLPAGTRIRVRMEGSIGSNFSSANDTFLTRVAVPVIIRGVTVLPIGTKIEGRVLEAAPAGFGSRAGKIAVRMETIFFAPDIARSIEALPTRGFKARRRGRMLPMIAGPIIGAAVGFAVGSAPGAAIGAGLGLGIGAGASYSRKGRDITLKEDDVFEIELKKEVVLPVTDY